MMSDSIQPSAAPEDRPPHNDSVRCQAAVLLPQHFLSDVGYRSFQVGEAHHLASE